ncbi:hypothetical protein PR048_010767 [Dryococelus australis]|uniref:Uncharacterized protein n=1 Tax=Dryococelus australis TaxID=614101 RepID=A0ABQ9I3M9_9NEOP|nr:hypothetical protein PR048_010767 [Dryococelus australis]
MDPKNAYSCRVSKSCRAVTLKMVVVAVFVVSCCARRGYVVPAKHLRQQTRLYSPLHTRVEKRRGANVAAMRGNSSTGRLTDRGEAICRTMFSLRRASLPFVAVVTHSYTHTACWLHDETTQTKNYARVVASVLIVQPRPEIRKTLNNEECRALTSCQITVEKYQRPTGIQTLKSKAGICDTQCACIKQVVYRKSFQPTCYSIQSCQITVEKYQRPTGIQTLKSKAGICDTQCACIKQVVYRKSFQPTCYSIQSCQITVEKYQRPTGIQTLKSKAGICDTQCACIKQVVYRKSFQTTCYSIQSCQITVEKYQRLTGIQTQIESGDMRHSVCAYKTSCISQVFPDNVLFYTELPDNSREVSAPHWYSDTEAGQLVCKYGSREAATAYLDHVTPASQSRTTRVPLPGLQISTEARPECVGKQRHNTNEPTLAESRSCCGIPHYPTTITTMKTFPVTSSRALVSFCKKHVASLMSWSSQETHGTLSDVAPVFSRAFDALPEHAITLEEESGKPLAAIRTRTAKPRVAAGVFLHVTPPEMDVPTRHTSTTYGYFSSKGPAVAERLACSLPTKANRVQSQAGSLPDFRTGELWWTMPLIEVGFLRDLPFSPPFHPGTAPYSLQSSSPVLKTGTSSASCWLQRWRRDILIACFLMQKLFTAHDFEAPLCLPHKGLGLLTDLTAIAWKSSSACLSPTLKAVYHYRHIRQGIQNMFYNRTHDLPTWITYDSAGMKGVRETEDHRENQPINGIVRHDSHLRKSGDPGRGYHRRPKTPFACNMSSMMEIGIENGQSSNLRHSKSQRAHLAHTHYAILAGDHHLSIHHPSAISEANDHDLDSMTLNYIGKPNANVFLLNKSAFRGMLKDYIAPNLTVSSKDVCSFLTSMKQNFINQLTEEIEKHGPLKYNIWLECNYTKPEPLDEGINKRSFKTSNVPLYNIYDTEEFQPASRTLHCLILAVADFPSAGHFSRCTSSIARNSATHSFINSNSPSGPETRCNIYRLGRDHLEVSMHPESR